MSFDCDVFFFFKQKTAYEMRISDWSSDVCSSDLNLIDPEPAHIDPDVGEAEERHDREGHPGVQRMFEPVQRRIPAVGRARRALGRDRKSVVSGKSVSVRVDIGGRRMIKKQNRQPAPQYATKKT